jgi:hypothetical protein
LEVKRSKKFMQNMRNGSETNPTSLCFLLWNEKNFEAKLLHPNKDLMWTWTRKKPRTGIGRWKWKGHGHEHEHGYAPG